MSKTQLILSKCEKCGRAIIVDADDVEDGNDCNSLDCFIFCTPPKEKYSENIFYGWDRISLIHLPQEIRIKETERRRHFSNITCSKCGQDFSGDETGEYICEVCRVFHKE